MQRFSGYKVNFGDDGCTVILYIDKQLYEFARDFDDVHGAQRKSIEQAAEDYIRNKLNRIKVNEIKIMIGSMLVSSFPFVHDVSAGPGQVQSPHIYIVKPGDTLYKIAGMYNLTVGQLKTMNKLTKDNINTGQRLCVPDPVISSIVNYLPHGIFDIGSRGQRVKNIQRALNALGYSVTEDGVYGLVTRNAVQDFQRLYPELASDGIYGLKTRAYLQKALLTDRIIV